MIRLRYYVGTQSGKMVVALEQRRSIGEEHLLTKYGGYTVFAGNGAWRNPQSGKAYHESSLIYEVLTETEHPYTAAFLKGAFGQESVLVTREQVNAEFV
jgi:hypothetical protein